MYQKFFDTGFNGKNHFATCIIYILNNIKT